MKNLYEITHRTVESPSNKNFMLHIHDNYEIFLFLEGDTKYIIEENVYSLSPGDLIVIRKNQMHRAYHNTPTRYSRFVLNVAPEFFAEQRCSEYEADFANPPSGVGAKIDAETVKMSGIYDAFLRLGEYMKTTHGEDATIVRSVIVEILYLINNIESYSKDDTSDNQLKSVIQYINRNFEKNITLDMLEKKFFISKYHLCHIFLKSTGLTVHQYITSKRLALALELIKGGKSITQAASLAGFSSYSSFFRGYKKLYGSSPKEVKKQGEMFE